VQDWNPPEKVWQNNVRTIALSLGWGRGAGFFYHALHSKGSWAGWPDICMSDGTNLIYAELKSNKGKLTQAQEDILDILSLHHDHVYLWRPGDRDEVYEILWRTKTFTDLTSDTRWVKRKGTNDDE